MTDETTRTRTVQWTAGTVTARTQGPHIYVEIDTQDDEPTCKVTPEFCADFVGLCYCLGMREIEPQTESEDGVDFLMRQVATCLDYLES